jgi:hypothetical protein
VYYYNTVSGESVWEKPKGAFAQTRSSAHSLSRVPGYKRPDKTQHRPSMSHNEVVDEGSEEAAESGSQSRRQSDLFSHHNTVSRLAKAAPAEEEEEEEEEEPESPSVTSPAAKSSKSPTGPLSPKSPPLSAGAASKPGSSGKSSDSKEKPGPSGEVVSACLLAVCCCADLKISHRKSRKTKRSCTSTAALAFCRSTCRTMPRAISMSRARLPSGTRIWTSRT